MTDLEKTTKEYDKACNTTSILGATVEAYEQAIREINRIKSVAEKNYFYARNSQTEAWRALIAAENAEKVKNCEQF